MPRDDTEHYLRSRDLYFVVLSDTSSVSTEHLLFSFDLFYKLEGLDLILVYSDFSLGGSVQPIEFLSVLQHELSEHSGIYL